MPLVVNDLAITVFVAAVGLLFGWLLRGISARRMSTCEEGGGNGELQRARDFLGRLHELAAQVAADVGQHSHRVEAINEELSGADVGEPDVVVKAIANLVEANNHMQRQLVSAEGKLQEQARQIQSHATAARTDALTGLANRRAFDDEIARRYAEFQRHGRTFSVLMMDVDHFKNFNDTHGHQAGDEVLRGVARVLRQTAREMDLVTRYGGEEFAVILPDALVAEATASIERMRKAVEDARFRFGGAELKVTVSMGVAHLLIDEDAANLIRRADAALYVSKEAGRNCSHWHDGQAVHPIVVAGRDQPPAAPPEETPARPAPPRGDALRPGPPPCDADRPADDGARPRAKRAAAPAETRDAGPAPAKGPRQASLYNRTDFCMVLGRRMAERRRGGPKLSVALVEIDRFDQIVARHGQPAAHLAWRATAQFLAAAVRDMDLVAQYDDRTFALLLPEASLVNTIDVAERLRQAIGRCKLPVGDEEVRITVSLGGVEATDTDDLQGLLDRAQDALSVASNAGGNRSYFHNGQCCERGDAALGRLKAHRG